ncbi:peroxisomal biogenesis factor 6 [Chiua virens]|nr:peroxisomal biogenesis factor 6 [Chiua virens]
MYIGESEANVRRVFQRARDAKPCVIFFDELDSIAPKRGNQGDSGGVMDRIVSQLLAELDGMSAGGMDVFVIGATNRPDLLDPALLRPGRFDRMLYLGVCETHAAQLDILKALTRKFNLDTNLDLSAIAEHCPFNYTGADFYALCADGLLHSLSCKVAELEQERAELNALSEYKHHPISPQFFISEMKSNADLQLVVKAEDFEFALAELIPSISNSELLHYVSIQQSWHH